MSSEGSLPELLSYMNSSTHLNVAIERESIVKVYRKRYWMLFLFSILSFFCGIIYHQYVSFANINICYYNISMNMLNWTVCMQMLSYTAFVFPASYLMNSIGLRWTVIAAAAANFFTFQSAPEYPPSQAQIKKGPLHSYTKSVASMFKNLNFILLFIVYGLTVGTYYAFATILTNLILRYFPQQEVEIGWMGTLFIVSGVVGSMIAGTVLDYTHRFKETALGICIASLLTFILFCSLLVIKFPWVTFLTICVFGFFISSFLPVGLEYGIELTFPEPEIISASLLTASTNLFGLIVTKIVAYLLEVWGQWSSNCAISIFLFISSFITIFLSSDYKRNKRIIEDSPKSEIPDKACY